MSQISGPGDNSNAEHEKRSQLRFAFEAFSEMSDQLINSYQHLESRIEQLTLELDTVSEEKLAQLKEKERLANRLQRLLDVLPAGVVVLDGHGKISECNPVANEILGNTLLDQCWVKVIKREFSPKGDDGHEVSLKDGRRVSIATQSLGDEPGQLILITDRTETRALQDKLNQQKRLSALGKMMATLAHEVRTPLSTALLYAANLEKDSRGELKLEKQQREKFSMKLMACLHELELQIKDMLVAVKHGESAEFEWVEVDALLSHLRLLLEYQLQVQGAELTLSNQCSNSQLYCQPSKVIGALQNLVMNSLQSAEGKAKITVAVVPNQDTSIEFVVSDNGCGMSDNIKDKVLEPFFTTRKQGTGLGLSMVQEVAKSHQGEVRIESSLGEGTEVGLRMPMAESAAPLQSNKNQVGEVRYE